MLLVVVHGHFILNKVIPVSELVDIYIYESLTKPIVKIFAYSIKRFLRQ